jgi:hypothetical protein
MNNIINLVQEIQSMVHVRLDFYNDSESVVELLKEILDKLNKMEEQL